MKKQTSEHKLYELLKNQGYQSSGGSYLEIKESIDRLFAISGFEKGAIYYDIDHANYRYKNKEFKEAVLAYEKCLKTIRIILKHKFVFKLFLYQILLNFRRMNAIRRIPRAQ